MTKKQYTLVLIAVILSGLIGGALSNKLLSGESLLAENALPPAKVLQAQTFVLVDEKGNHRARLEVNAEGYTALRFYDKDGQSRAAFGLFPKGNPFMGFSDQNEKMRLSLILTPEGSARFGLKDKRQ